jgi:hypothetical protein
VPQHHSDEEHCRALTEIGSGHSLQAALNRSKSSATD